MCGAPLRLLNGARRLPRAGDPARAALLLAASVSAAVDGPRAALAFLLVVPAMFALRLLPAGQRLDAALCTVLVTAQLGAAAGLTETTVWWDASAHFVTAALLLVVLGSLLRRRSPAVPCLAAAALCIGWEILEWLSDAAFQTQFAASPVDTLSDLALDMAGILVAVGIQSLRAGLRFRTTAIERAGRRR
jgi:hypothetical protein